MQDAAGLLSIGGDFIPSHPRSWALEAGTMEIAGDVWGAGNRPVALPEHVLVFNGDLEQHIYGYRDWYGSAGTVIVRNPAGVVLHDHLTVGGGLIVESGTLTGTGTLYVDNGGVAGEDGVINNDLVVLYGDPGVLPNRVGASLTIDTDVTLARDLVVDRHLTLGTIGSLDLAGFTAVAGQATLSLGSLFRMDNPASHLDVGGNLTWLSDTPSTTLTAGEISVAGDLTLGRGPGATAMSIEPGLVVRLDGTSPQQVSMEYSSATASHSHLFDVIFDNPTTISMRRDTTIMGDARLAQGTVAGDGIVRVHGNLITDPAAYWGPRISHLHGTAQALPMLMGGDVTLYNTPTFLTPATVEGGLTLTDGIALILDADLTVSDLFLSGDALLELAGHTVHVLGALDLRGTSLIAMLDAVDVLDVDGDTSFNGGDHTGYLVAGTMRFAGNLLQNGNPVRTTGTSHTILDGTGTQEVYIRSSGWLGATAFSTLEVLNPDVIQMTRDIMAESFISTAGTTYTATAVDSDIYAAGGTISDVSLNNVAVTLTGTDPVALDNSTFGLFDPTRTQLTVDRADAITLDRLTFETVPTTGLYLDGSLASSVTLTNATPATPGAFSAGAVTWNP